LNNGVYQAGFAQSQQAHDNAVDAVFDMLRLLDEHLAAHRYLCGEYVTEADWRLFVTLVRFDVAYHGAFKCNLARVADYPDLRNYLHELYQWPGVRDWVDFKHIKAGYYVNSALNPSLVVPKGPPVDLSAPHDRHGLPGRGVWTRR
jgi:putative glutathione S-transferase